MHRLVLSAANNGRGSYRSALMTSFCKDAVSPPNGVCKYIYLSLFPTVEGREEITCPDYAP